MTEPHLVLSRKYRPQKFSEVIYQDVAVNALQNALKSGRVGHAYIFFGPRGVGKTTIARILAKRVNCDSPVDNEPCNQCTSCVEITKGITNDVLEIDAASHRGIDYILQLRENVKFSAMGGKYKIYIIDEVHMLTDVSFNALLKTLEEPPPHVIFIMATTEYHKIPKTILSRCQDFVFKKVPLVHLQAFIEKICKLENYEYDSEGIFWIAKKGDGSVRDALSFMEQVITYSDSKIFGKILRDLIGYHGIETHEKFLNNILNSDNYADAITTIQNLFQEGEDLQKFLWDFLEFVHIIVLTKENLGDRENIDFPIEDVQKIKDKFHQIPMEVVILISERIYGLFEKINLLRLRNSYEIKIFIEIQIRKLIFDLAKPTVSGVVEKISELTKLLSTEGDFISSSITQPKKENPKPSSVEDVESLLKEKFSATDVDANKLPKLE
ncbi:MAG: DNA polymerase III subunit gamma/tau [Leptospiraceae bacterium]|nr:DNA polymerase III subunit gamma/tau [Leptospiraceae bacterium]MCK6381492.1 DNA polymerase III subunit gamma/tau [Leptospiraceae bacterium]NUM41737.1 DNA polymerase III subunit gamma/tau [Leptospiraceae bacterium]